MTPIRRTYRSLAFLVAALALLVIAPPASHGKDPAPKTTASCEHPCTRVDDCPKVTCECEKGSASDVAACDTENTHCCGDAHAACTRFCEINHQKWTGRFTPDTVHEPQKGDAPAGAPSATCNAPCKEATDCPTVSCQCAHGTAESVAACDVKTQCCGDARVVCEHYCDKKMGKWTGKLVEPSPRDQGRGIGEGADLNDGLDLDDDDGDREPYN